MTDDHDDDGAVEFQLDRKTFEFIGLLADELGTTFEKLACEALRRGLIRHFEKN